MPKLTTSLAACLLLASPFALAQDLQSQLSTFFSQRLEGLSDEVVVQLRSPIAMLPSCE